MIRHLWRNRIVVLVAAICADIMATNLALLVWFWFVRPLSFEGQLLFDNSPQGGRILFVAVLNAATFISYVAAGMYSLPRGISRIDESFKMLSATSIGVFVAFVTNLLAPQFALPDVVLETSLLIGGWVLVLFWSVLFRVVYRSMLSRLRRRGMDTRRVLIVGALEPGQLVYRSITRDDSLGYRVVGFASDIVPESGITSVPILGNFDDIGDIIKAQQVDLVIVALSGRASHELFDIIMRAEDAHVEVKLYPDAFTLITNNVVSENEVAGLPLLNVRNGALANPLNKVLKRLFDVAFASLVLLVAAPLMMLIAVLIKLESTGPAFFVQPRVGIDGIPFPTIKFRTMRVDAPHLASWTTKDDPRKTRTGTFLRRSSLDELPNFINVIRGEMSVVGPRPEQVLWVERFSQEIPYYMRRHQQKAGITGWAQANGLRGDTSIEDRTRYDLYYVENWSLLFDIKICIKTFVDIVTGRNKGY
jgi:Undecaprenyl-phosphate glucose phosphotransferase